MATIKKLNYSHILNWFQMGKLMIFVAIALNNNVNEMYDLLKQN